MKREELEAMGLSKENIDKIMQQNGQDIENAKHTAAAAEKQRADSLQTQLDTLNADLTAARNEAVSARDLKARLDEAEAKMKSIAKANAIRDALAEFNPRDAALVMKLLDDSKITQNNDGTLSGLKEQIEPMKTTSGYLFTDMPDSSGGTVDAGNSGNAFDMNAFLRG